MAEPSIKQPSKKDLLKRLEILEKMLPSGSWKRITVIEAALVIQAFVPNETNPTQREIDDLYQEVTNIMGGQA